VVDSKWLSTTMLVKSAYPGMVLSEAMYVKEMDAPPALY